MYIDLCTSSDDDEAEQQPQQPPQQPPQPPQEQQQLPTPPEPEQLPEQLEQQPPQEQLEQQQPQEQLEQQPQEQLEQPPPQEQQQLPSPPEQPEPLPEQLPEQAEQAEQAADPASVARMVEMGFESGEAQRVLRVAVGGNEDERIQTAIALLEGEEHNDMSADPSDAERAAALAAGVAIGSLVQKTFYDAKGRRYWDTAKVLRYCTLAGHLLRYTQDDLEERVVFSALPDDEWRCLADPAKEKLASRKRPRAQGGGGSSMGGSGIGSSSSGSCASASIADTDDVAEASAAAEAHELVRSDETEAERQRLLDAAALDRPPSLGIDGSQIVAITCDRFGWAHLRGLSVDSVQTWLRDTLKGAEAQHTQHSPSRGKHRVGAKRAAQRASGASAATGLQFVDWGAAYSIDSRNRTAESKKRDRTLLLERSQYPRALSSHMDKFFAKSVAERDFGTSGVWPSVPPCMLDLDQQLRAGANETPNPHSLHRASLASTREEEGSRLCCR